MLFEEIKTGLDLEKLKKRIAKDSVLFSRVLQIRKNLKYSRRGIANAMPTNAEMLALYHEMVASGEEKENRMIELALRKIKTKSNSGVAVVSLLTKPFPCPGRCTYCPNEREMPKSYLSKEPAAARALANEFDPKKQIEMRLQSLLVNGHPIDKIEIIIIGGTWSFYHSSYREFVIKECFRTCNEFGKFSEGRSFGVPKDGPSEVLGCSIENKTLSGLQKENETSHCRIVGLSVETRPDYISPEEIVRMREYGVTKVEIGVQHLDDAVLAETKRDMTAKSIANATELLRNAGIKVVYHMMPNLPGSDPEKDIAMFDELFRDGSGFQPDMLKIYPCMVLEGSELFEIWKEGKFRAYTDDELMHVLRETKKKVPPYVRILRVIRDIPASYVKAGSKISNMRQWLADDQKKNSWKCRCIRCREVREKEVSLKDFSLHKIEYSTLSGKELFLSYENADGSILASFARLRLPHPQGESLVKFLPELEGAALIRELHTYGRLVSPGKEGSQSQHVGFGKLLMAEAERITKEAGYKKLAVISGVGVREYYRKLGYELVGSYMIKEL